jgi:hypothetical protein
MTLAGNMLLNAANGLFVNIAALSSLVGLALGADSKRGMRRSSLNLAMSP